MLETSQYSQGNDENELSNLNTAMNIQISRSGSDKHIHDHEFIMRSRSTRKEAVTKAETSRREPGKQIAKETQQRIQKPAAAPVKHNLSESPSHNRRGPEYAYPRDSLQIALRQDDPIPSNAFLSAKSKEKEYWRRQRRVFVRSRFITNDEAAAIANSVYKHNPVTSQDRIVVTFQANIANFRSKWRKLLKEAVKKFLYISKAQVVPSNNETELKSIQEDIQSKVDRAMLNKIWGHWISDPFVDKRAFYASSQSVALLTSVTTKALYVTLQYHHGLLKERDFRKLLDDLDKFTRNIALPDPLL
ncbi:hypothetical protein BX666DRAFT_419662 [Dichotomocladium elegans]|nr:hypothetical protein BX666DRAFT_419662 [Dichotomocladium elegans]